MVFSNRATYVPVPIKLSGQQDGVTGGAASSNKVETVSSLADTTKTVPKEKEKLG